MPMPYSKRPTDPDAEIAYQYKTLRRKCLSCFEVFTSTHSGNRVCKTCKTANVWTGNSI